LLEPQRTNLALYSEQFDNAYWTKLNITITANNAVAPDGTSSADRFVLTSVSPAAQTVSRQIAIVSSTTTITFSTFVKYVDKQYIQLVFSGGFSSQFANFDLINGTVTAGTYVSANVQSYANGWYRISITTTGLTTNVLPFIWSIDTALAGRAADSTSTGTNSYLIWGAQIEAGAYATSYIPTLAASVTRVADDASKTGISSLIGQTEGTLFLEFDFTNIGGTQVIFSIHDSLNNKRLELWADFNTLNGFIGGSVNISIGSLSISNGRHKAAIAYKQSGEQAFYVDGVQVGTSATAYTIAALTALRYDYWNTGFPPVVGVRQTLLFKTRLTNAQLAELTTL
jgi:hypothetical protein